jgi:DNA-binding transcriptional MocR family regulator
MEKMNLKRIEVKLKSNPHKMMGGFSKTPNHFTLSGKYSPYEKSVYGVILTRSMNKGYCFPSQETIAKEAGCGLTKVKSVLKSLELKKLIKIEKGTIHKSNTYYIQLHNRSLYDDEGSREKTG